MKKKDILIWTSITIIIIIVAFYSLSSNKNQEDFAKCLTDKGIKFYGTYWCSHCANQKAMFGSSFENINYIECSLPERAGQTKLCADANIKAYPTWEFTDGFFYEGELTFQELSERSGCLLK